MHKRVPQVHTTDTDLNRHSSQLEWDFYMKGVEKMLLVCSDVRSFLYLMGLKVFQWDMTSGSLRRIKKRIIHHVRVLDLSGRDI